MLIAAAYGLTLLHLLCHELAHAAAARMLGIKVYEIKAGGGEPVLRIGRFRAALWITGGYTDVDTADLMQKSTAEKLLFFEAGCLADTAVWALLPLRNSGLYGLISAGVFFVLVFSNNCPFFPGSDIRGFMKCAGIHGRFVRGAICDDRGGDQEHGPEPHQSA